MVRRCIVKNCLKSSDEILTHRFPKNPDLMNKWIESLEITDVSIPDLLNKFVVCSMHFEEQDYRNIKSNFLNLTAIPKIEAISSRYRISSKQDESLLHNECLQYTKNHEGNVECAPIIYINEESIETCKIEYLQDSTMPLISDENFHYEDDECSLICFSPSLANLETENDGKFNNIDFLQNYNTEDTIEQSTLEFVNDSIYEVLNDNRNCSEITKNSSVRQSGKFEEEKTMNTDPENLSRHELIKLVKFYEQEIKDLKQKINNLHKKS